MSNNNITEVNLRFIITQFALVMSSASAVAVLPAFKF